MPYVYSTGSNNVDYCFYKKTNDLPIIERRITILGGANVANKQVVTPMGVATQITDEELRLLEGDPKAQIPPHPVFKMHMDAGFLKVDKKKLDIEKVIAKDMKLRDGSSPLTPEHLKSHRAKLAESSLGKATAPA